MKQYEIREIDGQKVFVKEIRPMFYLLNDVFVHICEGFVLNEKVILGFLNEKGNPVFPYTGAENGSIIVLSKSSVDPDEFVCSRYHLLNLTDQTWVEDARCAYDEYRSWAGV